MKKAAIIFLIMLFAFKISYAENEVSFQGIPWLSNDTVTIQKLEQAGFIRGIGDPIVLSHDSLCIINENDELGYQPDEPLRFKDYCYSSNLLGFVKGKIAGYPVKNILLTFAYDGEFKLIAARVELINAEYTSLKSKLIKVYGIGESKSIEEESIESIIWKGTNNSGILLYTESAGNEYSLIYGRLDAAEILANCIAIDSDDITGL